MGILVLIPILISPWESLNGQLVGKRIGVTKNKFLKLFFRRTGTFFGLLAASVGTYLLLLPRIDSSQKPLALAIAGLVFMPPILQEELWVLLGTCLWLESSEHG